MSVLPLLMRILDSSNDSCVLRLKSVDGILADLGVSSHQFDVAERFSRFDAELDMRMSQNDLNAYKVVNEYDETNLKRVFLDYGELKNAPVLQGPL
jgi:16S rRNA (cytosine1402-N4)-methyltransferase